MDSGQRLVVWRHQAITWTNADFIWTPRTKFQDEKKIFKSQPFSLESIRPKCRLQITRQIAQGRWVSYYECVFEPVCNDSCLLCFNTLSPSRSLIDCSLAIIGLDSDLEPHRRQVIGSICDRQAPWRISRHSASMCFQRFAVSHMAGQIIRRNL